MLTTFFFDTELTQDDLSTENDLLHTTLLSKWEEYGCLLYHKNDKYSLISSLSKVPPKYKQKWATAFHSFYSSEIKHNFSNLCLSDYNTHEDINKDFEKNGIQVGIIANTYSDLFTRVNTPSNPELLLLTELNSSIYFSKSELFASSDINESDNIQDIWNSKFSMLSFYSKKITIIDRYLIHNAIYDFNNHKKTSLEVFIELLTKNNVNANIQILSSCDIDSTQTSSMDCTLIMDKIRKKLTSQKIKLSLCNDKIFSRIAHDRSITFDNHTIQIGIGFELFRQSPMKNSTFNIKNKRKTNFDNTYSTLIKNRATGLTDL